MADYAFWAAIQTVKSRIGTWVGYDRVTQAGLDVSRADWARWVGEARAAVRLQADEITKPLNRRPAFDDILRHESQSARGFYQTIKIYVRDRDTGLEDERFFTVKTTILRSRQSIISEGLSRYENSVTENPDDYPEDILGASYFDTVYMYPKGLL